MGSPNPWADLLDGMSEERVIAWAALTDEQLDEIAAVFTEELPAEDPLIVPLQDRLRDLHDAARHFHSR